MKVLLALLVLLLVSGFVLNRSYASIYQKIGEKHLINPNVPGTYVIEGKTGTTQRLKYVAIGDSLTAGVGTTSSKESFPYLFSEQIAQTGRTVELTNLGIPGARTQDVIDSELQKTISVDPDIVTVLVGVNDIHGFVSRGAFQKNVETIINALTSKTKAKIILMTLPYLGTDDLIPWPYRWLYEMRTVEFNGIIKEIAENKHLTLVDLHQITQDASANNSRFYSVDQFHPSAEGYRAWSGRIYADSHF